MRRFFMVVLIALAGAWGSGVNAQPFNDLVIEFVRMNGKTQFAHTLYKKRVGPF